MSKHQEPKPVPSKPQRLTVHIEFDVEPDLQELIKMMNLPTLDHAVDAYTKAIWAELHDTFQAKTHNFQATVCYPGDREVIIKLGIGNLEGLGLVNLAPIGPDDTTDVVWPKPSTN